MTLPISQELAAQLALRLPEGRSVDDLRIVTCVGTVFSPDTLEDLTPEDKALIAAQVDTASGPPVLTDGVPTVMRVVAWLTHEGINRNRQWFLADDFGPAADRIREPNFLPMDWNHSAVFSWAMDPKAIGLWYRAEKRWDPKAKDGAGAYGILAYGIVWSWAFPDYATDMLAEQERNGAIEFSMACIPSSVTVGRDDTGPYEQLHDPVFLTLSALTQPPADPDARGRGKEGLTSADAEHELTQQLMSASAHADLTEDEMDELKKEIEALKAQLENSTTLQASLDAANTELAAAQATVTAAQTEIESLKATITEIETAKEALTAESAELKTALEAMKGELDAATAKLAEIATKEAEAATAARWATRLAELPESYRTQLAKRTDEERTRFEKKWSEASDEAWTEFKGEIAMALSNVQVSYLKLSTQEGGVLPNGESAADGVREILGKIRK